MLILLEHYSGYVYYALVLIVLIIISLLPFKKSRVFKALFRFSIVLGTLFGASIINGQGKHRVSISVTI